MALEYFSCWHRSVNPTVGWHPVGQPGECGHGKRISDHTYSYRSLPNVGWSGTWGKVASCDSDLCNLTFDRVRCNIAIPSFFSLSYSPLFCVHSCALHGMGYPRPFFPGSSLFLASPTRFLRRFEILSQLIVSQKYPTKRLGVCTDVNLVHHRGSCCHRTLFPRNQGWRSAFLLGMYPT